MKQFNNQFATQKLRENFDQSKFNVNKLWDFLETKPFYNKEYMPKFNTAEEIWAEFGPKEKQMYADYDWDGDPNGLHYREQAALKRRATYDALAGKKTDDKSDYMKLRENIVKFTIDNSDLYTAIMDKFMRPTGTPISDEGDYLETDLNTFDRIQDLAQSMGFEDGVDYHYEIESDYMKRRKDPEYGKDVIDYSGTKIDEEGSVTGTGATMTPGTGEQYATTKAFKKKNEEKDVEPKLAAGKAKVYAKDKWGWKDAPSIPNRPSKGGFIYKQMFEELNENYSRFKNETKTKTNEQQFHAAVRLAEKKIREANRILEYTAQLKSELSMIKENKNTQKLMERITRGIAEAYGKMKKLK